MPAPYSPSIRLLGASDPPLPACDPKDLATFRELLDARAYLRGAAFGAIAHEDRVTVGGNAAAPSLAVETIYAATVRDANSVWWVVGGTATVTPGALAASTMHYLFLATNTSGASSFVVTTTAPGVGPYRATGNQYQRFLAAFATGLLGFPLPAVVRERSGRYIASSGRAELEVLSAGRATTWTTVDLSHLVPPWATTVHVHARLRRAAADAALPLLQVRRSGDASQIDLMRASTSTLGGVDLDSEVSIVAAIPVSGQAFQYQLSAAVTASDPNGARFTVVGWD